MERAQLQKNLAMTIHKLAGRWQCENKKCNNFSYHCYYEAPKETHQLIISHVLGIWATAISKSGAGLDVFPMSLKLKPIDQSRGRTKLGSLDTLQSFSTLSSIASV